METTVSFGYWVRRQRKSLDLTQQALADRVGCSVAAIKKIEADERRPSRQIAERMADSLEVPAERREIFVECARGLRPVDQLTLAEGQANAPPRRKLTEPLRNNLPVQVNSFIGRARELAEVRELLSDTRLLTLTGPGGTGKTRLSLEVAGAALEANQFPDGIWLVELAPLADPGLVAQTVAGTMGLGEQPGRRVLDVLTDYVRAKTLLLILDNCEHLISACARIVDGLLHASDNLKILASSRESLGIDGETVYRVPSLPVPEATQYHDFDAISRNDCVHLFVDRAVAVHSGFVLKQENALCIADICRRLDGIPLAIELAAVRTKIFPPEEIASRLDDRFRLLTGGSRAALERHQTLRALIDWSHNLLSDPERALLRRLSVFAGGCTLEAAEAVCGQGMEGQVLELLAHLVDKSLVAVEERAGRGRYHLPETIRQYAREKLFESDEAEETRDAHLEFFMGLAEDAEPKLRSAEQLEWLAHLEAEHDNLRTALAWSLESARSDPALQLAGALESFWELRGYLVESQKWLEDALALYEREQSKGVATGKNAPSRAETEHHARALYGAAIYALVTMDLESGLAGIEESLRLWRELGDNSGTAMALVRKGFLLAFKDDIQASLICLEESVSLARRVGDPWLLATCLVRWGDALRLTDAAAARLVLEEGVGAARIAGDRSVLSEGLRKLGSLYYLAGDLAAAKRVTDEARQEARAIASLTTVLLALMQSVVISCLQNDPAGAKDYCFELWDISKETGALMGIGFSLITFGLTAIYGGDTVRGVQLLEAFETLFHQHGFNVSSADPLMIVKGQALEKGRAELGAAAFEAAQQEGRALAPEQAIALALKD